MPRTFSALPLFWSNLVGFFQETFGEEILFISSVTHGLSQGNTRLLEVTLQIIYCRHKLLEKLDAEHRNKNAGMENS